MTAKIKTVAVPQGSTLRTNRQHHRIHHVLKPKDIERECLKCEIWMPASRDYSVCRLYTLGGGHNTKQCVFQSNNALSKNDKYQQIPLTLAVTKLMLNIGNNVIWTSKVLTTAEKNIVAVFQGVTQSKKQQHQRIPHVLIPIKRKRNAKKCNKLGWRRRILLCAATVRVRGGHKHKTMWYSLKRRSIKKVKIPADSSRFAGYGHGVQHRKNKDFDIEKWKRRRKQTWSPFFKEWSNQKTKNSIRFGVFWTIGIA